MRFAAEIWLYVIPLLPLLWLGLRAGDRRANGRLARLLGARAGDHVEGANPRLRGWRRFLCLAGLFWLLLALARPQWGASEVAVTQRGSDIVVALDISNSMLAEDVPPNRVERAKAELGAFLNRLQDSRVGLVFFAGSAFVQCPLTLDYGTADIFLQMAAPDMLSEQGTALGAALETARGLLAKGREGRPGGTFQAILLVTDGEDLEGAWEDAARDCVRDGIKLIPVGVGEAEGGLIPVSDRQGRPAGFMKDDDGNVVLSRLDMASLERMASLSGGSPFRIGVDGLAGDRLFAELERMGKRDLEERRISAYEERYVWPLLLAAACFALRLLLAPRRSLALAAAACALLLGLQADAARAGVRPAGGDDLAAGRAKYLSGDYEGALRDLESALVAAPDDPRISLAVGETLSRLQRYEEAAQEFDRTLSLTDDPRLRAEALYNAGTNSLAAGETERAVDQLRRSLRLDPEPQDALLNLEAALRRQEQEQQQEQQNQDQQDQDQQDQDQQDQDQQDQDQQDQDQQDQDQQDQDQQDEDQQDEQDQQQDQDEQQDEQQDQQQDQQQQEQQQEQQEQPQQDTEPREELTREQAMQILKALDRDEEELKKSVQKRLKGGRPRSGKRW